MDIKQLEVTLKKLGYEIKKSSGKNIDVIVVGDRIAALQDIAKRLNGKYNPKGGSSSVGRAELMGGFTVNAKPKGGGSGAGSDVTTLAESAQCVYAAAIWYGKDYSGDTFDRVSPSYLIDGKLDDIINKLPGNWVDSCILTAELLKKNFGNKRYIFHRGSSWVKKLQDHWLKLNREEQAFTNLNKWSPADIYMTSQAGERIDFTKAQTIIELNNMMMAAIESKDVIGVSLKQVKGTAKLEFKNTSDKRKTYAFESVTLGKRGFLLSGDGYLMFDGGQVQFRTFGSTWQGEIKGKNANMGKISGGPINSIMKKNGINIIPQAQFKNTDREKLMKDFYTYYKYFEPSPISEKDFYADVFQRDENWWTSKFLSAQFLYNLDTQTDKMKDKIVSSIVGYAASESELSAPYAKVS